MASSTPRRPRLLDLFCGAGGAAVGYHRAGFDVVGVDLEPQPHYPYEFHRADAMTWPLDGFDAIHASPPCHDYTPASNRQRIATGPDGTGHLLVEIGERVAALGVPWVIENVEAAGPAMPRHAGLFRLCGSSFGLDLRRHRLFASNVAVLAPPCAHGWQTPRFFSLDGRRKRAGYLANVVGVHGHSNYAGELAIRKAAMEIDWMNDRELALAIPPAYTAWIGAQLLAALETRPPVPDARINLV